MPIKELNNQQKENKMKMKKITRKSIATLFFATVSSLASADAFNDFMRQQIFESRRCVDEIMADTPKPVQEDRTMSYYVSNSSGSRIEALYFRGASSNSWSGNCVTDPSALDWLNTHVLYLQRSSNQYGSPRAYLRPGERERDLNGNYWMSAGQMVVDVPLGGYDGYAYRMKVRWEDGTEREFHLPYPWGNVIIYKNRVNVHLGVSGRGMFHREVIAPL